VGVIDEFQQTLSSVIGEDAIDNAVCFDNLVCDGLWPHTEIIIPKVREEQSVGFVPLFF